MELRFELRHREHRGHGEEFGEGVDAEGGAGDCGDPILRVSGGFIFGEAFFEAAWGGEVCAWGDSGWGGGD